MIRDRRCRRLLAAGTAAVLVLGCSDDGDEPAATTTSVAGVQLRPEAIEDFLREVRLEDGVALANRTDDELVADGQVFCDELGATGSALDAANALQAAAGTYEGQTRLIEVARGTLCPEEEGS